MADCPKCGGVHFGTTEETCPIKDPAPPIGWPKKGELADATVKTIEVELTRLDLQATDRLLVTVKGPATSHNLSMVKECVERLLRGSGTRFLVLGLGDKTELGFQVISPEQATVIKGNVVSGEGDGLGVE